MTQRVFHWAREVAAPGAKSAISNSILLDGWQEVHLAGKKLSKTEDELALTQFHLKTETVKEEEDKLSSELFSSVLDVTW